MLMPNGRLRVLHYYTSDLTIYLYILDVRLMRIIRNLRKLMKQVMRAGRWYYSHLLLLVMFDSFLDPMRR